MTPRTIPESDFIHLFSPKDWIDSCDKAFRLLGQGLLLNPPRVERVEKQAGVDRFSLNMPAEWVGHYRGEKIIVERSDVATGRLEERIAKITLKDLTTGTEAEIEADFITNARTGAAGALGARYLARPDAQVAALIGTGRIGKFLAVCIDYLFELEEIRATSRKRENRTAFEDEIGPRIRSSIRMKDSLSACIEGADIVLTAVPTPTPILHGSSIGPHVHLSVMGGDSRTTQLDPDLLWDRPIVVDDMDQAAGSGDFLARKQSGRYDDIRFVKNGKGIVQNIGDAAIGRLDHLRGTGVITYFTGLAAQDLLAAAMVFEKIEEKTV